MNNLQQYSDLAHLWWDTSSPFRDLIHLNPVRFDFFKEYSPEWSNKRVLDLGCGGGFLAEELARRGATVVGVDPSERLLTVARAHAAASGLQIDYQVGTGENIPADEGTFDVVVCVDVLEHVADLDLVLKEVRRVLKPDGLFLYDTINRSFFSFLWMIVALEWISGRIPRGTHDWRKFIRPRELVEKLNTHGFATLAQKGIKIHRLQRNGFSFVPQFTLSPRQACVYVGAASKATSAGVR